MTSKQIEEIAVHTVGLYFSKSQTISPYISDNDKEPCWDGNLYVYSNPDKTNSSLYGRIPVQIKGKTFKSGSIKSEIKYPVSTVNLRNYKRDGGILYFVVGIWDNCQKIYYAELTPLRLKQYIKQSSGNASCSIKLSLLGEYSANLDYKIRDFYENCKIQANNTEKTINLDALTTPGKTVNLTFFASEMTGLDVSIPQYLATHSVYLYANISDEFNNTLLRPIGEETISLKVIESVPATIKVNGKTYFNEFRRQHKSNGGVIITVGQSLLIELYPNSNQDNKVSFTLKEKELDLWIHEAEFILDLSETNCLEIGDCKLKVHSLNTEQFLSWTKDRLEHAKKLQRLLDELNVNKQLILKQFTQTEENTIKILYKAICENQEVSIKEELKPVFTVNLSNLCIALSCSKTSSGKYRLSSYKNVQEAIYYSDDNTTSPLRTSIYSWFQEDGFLTVSNIDYDDIVPSYKKVKEYNPNIAQRANNDMLMMLLAYDKNQDKRLLKAAGELCQWLTTIQDKNDQSIYILNMLQIRSRERQLTKDERGTLMDIVDTVDNMGKVACYILLDNKEQVEHYLKKLNKSEVSFFKSLPIYNIYIAETLQEKNSVKSKDI